MWTTNRGIRRIFALGAAGTAVALAVGLMPSSGSATTCVVEDVDTGDPPTQTVRVASYNAAAGTSVRENRQDIRTIIDAGADIISLQEMSSRKKRRMVRRTFDTCDGCVYNGYIPIKNVPGALPILYREDKFDFVDLGKVRLTKDTYVGPRGAGPSTLRARWVTWLKLRDYETGRHIVVLNTHAVPTVQRSNGEPNWKLRERVLMYRQHLNRLRDMIADIRANPRNAAFVTGDLNVNYRTDRTVSPRVFPHHTLGQVRTRANWEPLGRPRRGTHVLKNGFDKRLIDYVYFMHRRWVDPKDQRIMFGLHSDHRPVLVDFEVYSRKCFENHKNTCA